jgi:hypothetical protein
VVALPNSLRASGVGASEIGDTKIRKHTAEPSEQPEAPNGCGMPRPRRSQSHQPAGTSGGPEQQQFRAVYRHTTRQGLPSGLAPHVLRRVTSLLASLTPKLRCSAILCGIAEWRRHFSGRREHRTNLQQSTPREGGLPAGYYSFGGNRLYLLSRNKGRRRRDNRTGAVLTRTEPASRVSHGGRSGSSR